MASPAAVLSILVEANTTKATTNLRKVDSAASKAHTGLTRLAKSAAGLGAAFVSFHAAKDAVESTEALAKSTINLKRNFGLTATEASKWSAVLQANNISMSSAQMSFTTLAKQIQKAGEGSKPAVQAFKDLGISGDAIKKQNLSRTLDEVVASLSKMEGGSKRAADAQILLGRGGKLLAPLFRADGLGFQQQAKWAQQYGVTLDGHAIKSSKELAIASQKLKFAQMGLQVQFTEAIVPALTKVAGAVSGVITHFNQLRSRGKSVSEALSTVLSQAVGRMATIAANAAPHVAVAFVHAWLHAGIWAQLFTVAFFAKRLGLFGTLGGMAANRFANRFGSTVSNSIPGKLNSGGIRGIFGAWGAAMGAVAAAAIVQKIATAIAPHSNKPGIPTPGGGGSGLDLLHKLGIHFRSGGGVPGTGSGDKVPAMLEPGEFVIRKAVVDKFGPGYFANINRMASGGPVATSGAPQTAKGDKSAQQVARVQAYMRQIWGTARNFYPGAAGHGMPRTLFTSKSPDNLFVGDFFSPSTNGKRGGGQFLGWPNWFLSSLDPVAGKKRGKSYASAGLETLIHEWAHYFQDKGQTASVWRSEGGADAFAREFAPIIYGQLGIPYKKNTVMSLYDPYVAKVHGKLGESWIKTGQFSSPSSFLGQGVAHMAAGGLVGTAQLDKQVFPTNMQQIMLAIAMAESGGRDSATGGPNRDGSYDYGRWQINSSHGYSIASMRNGLTNAKEALSILRSQGLGAWTTYTSGAYRQYMGAAASALARVTGGRIGGGGRGGAPSSTRKHARLVGKLVGGSRKIPMKAKPQSQFDLIENYLSGIDLSEQAGQISSGQAQAARDTLFGFATSHPGKFTGAQLSQLIVDTGHGVDASGGTDGSSLQDAIDANTAALQAQAQALQDLRDEMKRNTDFATSVSQTQYGQLTRAIAAVASGEIGGKVGLAFSTPSSPGRVASL